MTARILAIAAAGMAAIAAVLGLSSLGKNVARRIYRVLIVAALVLGVSALGTSLLADASLSSSWASSVVALTLGMTLISWLLGPRSRTNAMGLALLAVGCLVMALWPRVGPLGFAVRGTFFFLAELLQVAAASALLTYALAVALDEAPLDRALSTWALLLYTLSLALRGLAAELAWGAYWRGDAADALFLSGWLLLFGYWLETDRLIERRTGFAIVGGLLGLILFVLLIALYPLMRRVGGSSLYLPTS